MCRRLLTTLLLSLLLAALAYANATNSEDNKGLTAEKCFKEAPGTVLGLISPNTRLDMIDYYRAGIDRQSANTAGGKCSITDLQDYSITFIGGNGIEYQMFVLDPIGNNPIIGLIQTLDTPIPDSALTLYRSDWTIIPTTSSNALGREPDYDAWVKPTNLKEISNISETVPFVLAKFVYDPSASTLTATNNTSSYFVTGDMPDALSKLKDKVTYKWQPKVKAFLPEK